jgi:hypothetical protein
MLSILHAQPASSLLRCWVPALYHHQLLSSPRLSLSPAESRSLSPGVGAGPLPLSLCGGRLCRHARACAPALQRTGAWRPVASNTALKQGFARRLLRKLRLRADLAQGQPWHEALEAGHIWQRRFYDFVVFSKKKRLERCVTCTVTQ